MSTHEVKIVRISEIFPHENADALEIVKIWGYSCVVKKDQFKIGDLAAYIEPDYEVDKSRPEFSFLSKNGSSLGKNKHRIAVCRLRGIYSAGLLIPAPEGSVEGDNVIDILGVTRYEPALSNMVGNCPAEHGPELHAPKYDLENYQKFSKVILPTDEVILTVKLHGTSARFVFHNGRMYCGSKTMWRRRPDEVMENGDIVPVNAWWEALKQNPWIETFCTNNPDVVLYGEIVGEKIQGKNFHYNYKQNSLGFYVFDILENGRWLPNSEFSNSKFSGLQFVPEVHSGAFSFEQMKQIADLEETFNSANHIREGIVIKLKNERIDEKLGRVALKYVSNKYLEHG
jgi:RNA ligase (TIGR02306 family)